MGFLSTHGFRGVSTWSRGAVISGEESVQEQFTVEVERRLVMQYTLPMHPVTLPQSPSNAIQV